MSRLRIMGVSLLAVFAIAAVVSASASAALPAFYQCNKAAKNAAKKYTGKYIDSKCSEEATKEQIEKGKENKYELEEWNEENGGAASEIKGKGGPLNWSVENVSSFSCSQTSETGYMSGPKSIRDLVIILKGCESAGLKFENTETEGEVKTEPLTGEIGYFDEAKGKTVQRKVGLDLKAEKETEGGYYLAHFHGGSVAPVLNLRWKGGIIAEIAEGPKSPYNKFSKELELNYEEIGGKQAIQSFEAGLKEILITETCKGCSPTLPEDNTAWSSKIVDKGEELMLEE